MSLKPNYSSRSRSEKVADECSRIDSRGEICKHICWSAVLYVLHQKNVISSSKFQAMLRSIDSESYESFIPAQCPIVRDVQDLYAVPRGSILGFFKRRNERFFLAHAMIYVGNGNAFGLNNGAIGQSPGWTSIRLDDNNVAAWGGALSFNYAEVGNPNSRVDVEVRYRDIDDINRPSCMIM